MRRGLMISALMLSMPACQGTGSVPTPSALTPTFSNLNVPDSKGPPSGAWTVASNGQQGNVDVYSAKTLKMISQCPCTGVGLAVDPKSGDLAVGARSGTVTVWHVKSAQITQFATLTLSQGPYAVGLAFDMKGDLYAANADNDVIDFFKSSEIEAGGGAPTHTLLTSHLTEAVYLAADAHSLLANSMDVNGQPLLVSVNTSMGADTILAENPVRQFGRRDRAR